jgi:nifR3 family TIM-barrel protein
MAMAAEMAEEQGADILDVNCGCPAPKVVKKGGGSGLLANVPLLEEILKEVKKSISIPLTLKIRAGFDDENINAVEVAKMAEQCGVQHVALHGRTRTQRYTGLADWDLVKQIKEAVSIPVSGNGDVTSVEKALQRFKETGCDGILIGRGAMQNPWLFRQIQDAIEGREPFQPSLQDKQEVLLEFFNYLSEDMPENAALGKMKQLAGQFTKGLRGGAKFRQTLYHSHSAEEILTNIAIYFDTLYEGKDYGDNAIEKDVELLASCDAMSG